MWYEWREEKCTVSVRKSERNSRHGRPRHRQRDIKMDIKEIEWEGVEWIHLAYARDQWWALVNMGMGLWAPENMGNSTS
jgi:hypothetical protein